MKTAYRDGNWIYWPQDEEGLFQRETFPSINAAKRRSRIVQAPGVKDRFKVIVGSPPARTAAEKAAALLA